MKAVVFHGIGDIRFEDVPEPALQAPTDAIVRLTASAICGTDLHFIRGTVPGMKAGTVLGHEGVGIVEALGEDVRNLSIGDRVLIPSTIACGTCSYCRAGYTAQCDAANPHGKTAGTAFYGGPATTGPFHGLQAEKARVPFAHVNLFRLPDEISDDEAILLSDILPTGWFGADNAEIGEGDTVAVFGCGPVGLCAIAAAKLMGAGRVLAIDTVPDRLDEARKLGAETIDFEREDPVEVVLRLTDGIGVDRAIDAVGVDSNHAHHGPAGKEASKKAKEYEKAVREIAPKQNRDGDNWHPGDAPGQALEWAVKALAKAGTLSIIGVYPETAQRFPIGAAMNKNLTIKMGNCNHKTYLPHLIELVRGGQLRPTEIVKEVRGPFTDVLDAYKQFDRRQRGWIKVELLPDSGAAVQRAAE
jgi:threonine dehydrogenase-like Zn-dependent dehydrogenase